MKIASYQIPKLRALVGLFLALPASLVCGQGTDFSLEESITVNFDGNFPNPDANTIDKFNVSGTEHSFVAPFDTNLFVRSSTSGLAANLPRRSQLYLQFNLSALTSEGVESAVLKFDAYSLGDVNAETLNVFQLANDWAVAGSPDPVFNPDFVGAVIDGGSVISGTGTDIYDSGQTLDGVPIYRNTTSYSIDVTAIAQSWQSGEANHGFLLALGTNSTSNQGIGIDSASLVLNIEQFAVPTATLSSVILLTDSAYSVTIDFSEDVTGLTVSDFSVTNGAASDLMGTGASYTVTITPDGGGDISVSLPADSVTADGDSDGNLVSNVLNTMFGTAVPPNPILSGTPATVSDSFTVNLDFFNQSDELEEVDGISIEDVTVTNGAVTSLVDFFDGSFSIAVTPTAPGTVTVSIPANVVTSTATGAGNAASEVLSVEFALPSLTLMPNSDLNTIVGATTGISSGTLGLSYNPDTDNVVFGGNDTAADTFEWIYIPNNLSRGYGYDSTGDATGDGAFLVGDAALNQRYRGVHYFVDDDKRTTGPADFAIDFFIDDNTTAGDLELTVELYGWNDDETAPSLSWGGGLENFNVDIAGDAVALLDFGVSPGNADVPDATWFTVTRSFDLGVGYDNYAWRIGVNGQFEEGGIPDVFGFDNLIVTADSVIPGGDEIEITDITASAGVATLDFTSSGNVDVYRSLDLQNWGSAIATDQAAGTFSDNAAPAGKAFYILVPTGQVYP